MCVSLKNKGLENEKKKKERLMKMNYYIGQACLYSSGSISHLEIQFNISKSYQDAKKLSYTRMDISNAIGVLSLGFTVEAKAQWGSAIATLVGTISEALKSFDMEKHICFGLNISNDVQHVPSDRLLSIAKGWSKISKSIRSGKYSHILRYNVGSGLVNESVTKFSAALIVALINSKDGTKKERAERQKGKKDRGKRKRKDDDDDEWKDPHKKKSRTLSLSHTKKGNQVPRGNVREQRTFTLGNVLLSKNNLYWSADIPGISQERLLSFVAERLIDSNINVDNKDAWCVENQERNIADAIDLLSLTTGIDVNIKFKGITEFEITRECAIFDLLDLSLYHGWIGDPQLSGQLYLLATDRCYINQPDLVWEKLNEVNGNRVFMTGSFKEFKAAQYHTNNTWDEQNARASTADYLASIDDSTQDYSSCSLDLQLAMPLQEQKFGQQPQRNRQKQFVAGCSWLVTGLKLGGQLYVLATDQGYINQADLVWEKLNEVCNWRWLFKNRNWSGSLNVIHSSLGQY